MSTAEEAAATPLHGVPLRAPIEPLKPAPDASIDVVEWRVDGRPLDRNGQTVSRFVPYIDAATVAGLLDDWVGPDRWSDSYEAGTLSGTAVLWCHLSVLTEHGWVTKRDVGKPSQFEKEKGTVSDAFKRAACLKWGAGRNVYSLPTLNAPCRVDQKGNAWPIPATLPAIIEQLDKQGFITGGKVRVPDEETAPEPEPQQQRTATKAPAKRAAPRKAPPRKAKPKTAEEVVAGLAGEFGAEHAARVATLIEQMNGVEPETDRREIKEAFVAAFGSPAVLHPEKVDEAEAYLSTVLDPPPAAAATVEGACLTCGAGEEEAHVEGCPEAPFD